MQNILKTIETYESQIRHLKMEVDHEKNSRVTFQEKVERLSRQKGNLESIMVSMVDEGQRYMLTCWSQNMHSL